MKKIMEGIENEKNITKDSEVENELDQLKNSSLDELENAPEDMAELFAEPPLLDFDSEPTDEDLKLEEMDIDNLEEDLNNWETEILNKGIKEGMKEGIKEGMKEGKLKGMQETQEQIAKKLKSKLPVDEISQITGLPEEKINKL